ncbi:hypothetical protein D6C98_01025 [Aureobasidium pullulans]|nr:hypothetical protein D6D26_05431 [Aureobasidium pullulans]THY63698.1 hypothetical protein D6C98_01025 [Aureobasidium pullulans]
MANGMEGFVKSRDPGGAPEQFAAPHASRPPTVQKIRDTQEHDVQHHVYGTDTEGFDDTRSSLSEQVNSDGDHDEGEYDQEEQHSLDHILELDASQLDHAMWQMRNGQLRGHQINSDPESYPPTTSGEPEPMEEYETQDEGAFVPQPAQAYAEPARDAYTTNVPTERHPPVVAMPIQPRHVIPSKEEFKTQAKLTLTQKDILRQKKSQSKAQVTSNNQAAPAQEQLRGHGQHYTSHKHPSKSPDHASPSLNDQSEHPHRQAPQIKPEEGNRRHQRSNGATHPQQRAKNAEPYDQGVKRDDYPQQGFDRTDRHEQRFNRADQRVQYTDRDDHHEQQELDHAPEESHEQDPEPEELDYDPEELFIKSLDELQRDPFEGPPREEPEVPPTDFSSKSLEEKLKLAAGFEPEKQRKFLASLTIDEWETAGDWFQDRFSEVFEKLKEARRARRTLAMKYEQEIAKRQQEVSKKRKITEEALSGMRVTGAQVLDSTPKKKQKLRE